MSGCWSKGVGAVDKAVGVVNQGVGAVGNSRLMKHDWKEKLIFLKRTG